MVETQMPGKSIVKPLRDQVSEGDRVNVSPVALLMLNLVRKIM